MVGDRNKKGWRVRVAITLTLVTNQTIAGDVIPHYENVFAKTAKTRLMKSQSDLIPIEYTIVDGNAIWQNINLGRHAIIQRVGYVALSANTTGRHSVLEPSVRRGKRATTLANIHYWPGGIVYYSLTNVPPQVRDVFLTAATHISQQSAVRFVERTDQPNYLYLTSSSDYPTCFSSVGMVGGPQQLELSSHCHDRPDVLHELMHALGLGHEHQRDDRDQYVDISPGLLDPKQFVVNQEFVKVGPYDIDSVTHYELDLLRPLAEGETISGGKRLFGHIALRNAETPVRAGPRNTLSDGDIAALSQLYPGVRGGEAQKPTDNGLRAVLSKHGRLVLVPNTASTVIVQIPSSVPVSETRVWSDNALLAVTSETMAENVFRLTIQAQPGVTTDEFDRVFFEFRTADSKVGTRIFQVNVVTPEQLPSEERQLVLGDRDMSLLARQCLTARRTEANKRRRPGDSKYPPSWLAAGDKSLDAVTEACNSENALQAWRLDTAGALINHTGHCLSLPSHVDSRAANRLTVSKCDLSTLPDRKKWRRNGTMLHNVAYPELVLSGTTDNDVLALPAPSIRAKWQQWYWY